LLHLTTLGQCDLTATDGRDASALVGQPKRFALLAYLAVARPRGWQRRDILLTLLWPEADQERGRRALRDTVYAIRRLLGESVIEGRGSEELAIGVEQLSVDVVAFEAAIAEGRLADALACYRGDFLSGVHIAEAPDFSHWLDSERARLRTLALGAARALREAAGDGDDAIRWAERALAIGADEEADAVALIAIHAARGERAAALDVAERYATRLEAILGMQPGPAFEQAVTAARAAVPTERPSIVAAPSPPPRAPVEATRVVPPREPRVSRRALGFTLVAMAVLTAGLIAWRGRTAPLVQPGGTVLVIPFQVHGDGDAALLGDGVGTLLGAALDGAGRVRVVDPHAVAASREDTDRPMDVTTAVALAKRFSADAVVLGSAVLAGPRVKLTAYLYDRSGREMTRADVLAATDSLFDAVDDLGRRLLGGLLLRKEEAIARRAGVSTRSLSAFRDFLRGEAAFRRGRFDEAREAFTAAVRADSTFALAWYRLSGAADWIGDAALARHAIAEATRWRGTLTAEDQLLVEGREHYWLGDAAKAERAYERLTAARPTSVEAWFELAEIRFHAGPWRGRSLTEAKAAFERVVELVPDHAAAWLHLARIAAVERQVSDVDRIASRVSAIEPGHERGVELVLLRAGLTGTTADVSRAREALRGLEPGYVITVTERMAAFSGNPRLAWELLRDYGAEPGRLNRDQEPLESLGEFAAGAGEWDVAWEAFDRLASAAPLRAVHARAVTTIAMGPAVTPTACTAALRALQAAPASRVAATEIEPVVRFALEREALFTAMLGACANDAAAASHGVMALDSLARRGEADDPATRVAAHYRDAAQAYAMWRRGEGARGLDALVSSWPPAIRSISNAWAWNHPGVLLRMLRAQLHAEAGDSAAAAAWHASVLEDIGGTPAVWRWWEGR
jgi:DNA-binding SARP family transcriptional activator/tetratricopeptide (TPR) repeat protein